VDTNGPTARERERQSTLARVRVRTANIEDVPELARLRAQWRGAELSAEFTAQLREWFLREQHTRWWWLAETDSGEIVGMVNVKLFDRMPSPDIPPSRWGYLANLFVTPHHRGGGAGALLISAAVERAQNEGLVRLVLAPSEQAVPLYGRFGFRDAHELLLRPLDQP
jgi:GNAT superfamily N-acetyltransferase